MVYKVQNMPTKYQEIKHKLKHCKLYYLFHMLSKGLHQYTTIYSTTKNTWHIYFQKISCLINLFPYVFTFRRIITRGSPECVTHLVIHARLCSSKFENFLKNLPVQWHKNHFNLKDGSAHRHLMTIYPRTLCGNVLKWFRAFRRDFYISFWG